MNPPEEVVLVPLHVPVCEFNSRWS